VTAVGAESRRGAYTRAAAARRAATPRDMDRALGDARAERRRFESAAAQGSGRHPSRLMT